MQQDTLLKAFEPNKTIRRPALLSLLSEQYPKAKLTTLDWHIHTLLEQGKLVRRGRGSYALVADKPGSSPFDPPLPNELVKISERLSRQFALTTTCVWSTAVLHSFMQQQPFVTYWLVETERDAVDSILDSLILEGLTNGLTIPIYRANDLALMERYRPDTSTILLIKPLISEAPMQQNRNGLTVPTLEKILVDLVADSTEFGLFAEELPALFPQLNNQFDLNQDRLRRYARRRHKLPLINQYLTTLATRHDS
ncbi:hypothetical protein GCM10028818_57370 [Spirosoma horti]